MHFLIKSSEPHEIRTITVSWDELSKVPKVSYKAVSGSGPSYSEALASEPEACGVQGVGELEVGMDGKAWLRKEAVS